jgi:DNA-binding response OmpR family regulator
LQSGTLRVDISTRKVFLGGEEVRLSPTEFGVLVAPMERKGEIVSPQWLLEHVVGGDDIGFVYQHIKWLRDKLEAIGDPKRIATIRGRGYRFDG